MSAARLGSSRRRAEGVVSATTVRLLPMLATLIVGVAAASVSGVGRAGDAAAARTEAWPVPIPVVLGLGAVAPRPRGVRRWTELPRHSLLPVYFTNGYAVHGAESVPAHPASHGCVRVPRWLASDVVGRLRLGTWVIVR